MKLSTLSICLGFTAAIVAGGASAAEQGGKITFTGNVTNSACSISPESSDQTVDMGQISIKDLTDGDKTTQPRNFDIALENCVLSDDEGAQKTVSVTFSGAAASFEPGILGVSGTASDIGVAIAEQSSSASFLPLGTASQQQTLNNGNNTLHFSAYLIGGDKPTEGDFSSVANFILAYQ